MLETDLADGGSADVCADGDDDRQESISPVDKNVSISCELGIRYPTLQSILSGKNIQTTHVSL